MYLDGIVIGAHPQSTIPGTDVALPIPPQRPYSDFHLSLAPQGRRKKVNGGMHPLDEWSAVRERHDEAVNPEMTLLLYEIDFLVDSQQQDVLGCGSTLPP